MRRIIMFFSITLMGFSFLGMAQERYVLVIHGGAGNIPREHINAEQEEAYLMKLAEALKTGEAILEKGGSALDAVEATVRVLEDSPLFNAGRGAVFNMEGKNELDASFMCGKTLKAGAIAGVTIIKNPISAARKVMENSPHVMMMGRGAETFAYDQGCEIVDPGYFFDQRRWNQYREFIRNQVDGRSALDLELKMGTVGAVALDMHGNLAAATSTGGMVGKRYGRIGDSPIIGAGNYANNESCAVSATGHGEYFIRNVVAYDIAARMMYKGQSLHDASREVVQGKLKEQQANGGIIAVDRSGNISMEFNTSSMFRGYIKSSGDKKVSIFAD